MRLISWSFGVLDGYPGITGCVPWATVATFMTDYLAENGGLGTLRATGVCLSFGIGFHALLHSSFISSYLFFFPYFFLLFRDAETNLEHLRTSLMM